ncbi:hypothetical protein GCM10022259_11520 [Aquimarina mytili]
MIGMAQLGSGGCTKKTFWRDKDGDGWGFPLDNVCAWSAPSGYITPSFSKMDCNDNDPNIQGTTTWYQDADGDGYGNSSVTKESCNLPTGYASRAGDCNDANPNATIVRTWYRDADGDGYGVSTSTTNSCNPPSGYSLRAGDCNDSDGAVFEVKTWYRDADGDGYGTTNTTIDSCSQPLGYILRSGDCNDSNASIHPAAEEPCNGDGVDNNCNGQIDEHSPSVPLIESITEECGVTTIKRRPHFIQFEVYWQSSPNGISKANSERTITLTSGNVYYLRLFEIQTGCWSAAKTINYTINEYPSIPPVPNIQENCGNTVVTPGSAPSGVTWYWQSSATGTSTASAESLTRTTSGSTYLRGRNSIGCWGKARKIDYTVTNSTRWYADTDNDGFGDPNVSIIECSQPSGYVLDNNDRCPQEYGANQGCVIQPTVPVDPNLSNENYVLTRVYKTPKKHTDAYDFATDVIESVTYYDGLGRPIQDIAIAQSPYRNDIVQHYEYDQFGRTQKTYLPLPANQNTGSLVNNPVSQINTYYQNTYGDTNPYNEQRFEDSPLNRVVESASPGNAWQMSSGHTSKFEYKANVDNEVRKYIADNSNLGASYVISSPSSDKNYLATESVTITNGGHLTGNVHLKIATGNPLLGYNFYEANELTKQILKNENWIQTDGFLNTKEIFTDKNGKKVAEVSYREELGVLQKLVTRYVYDDYGRLIYVLPPSIGDAEFREESTTETFSWDYLKFFGFIPKIYHPDDGGSIEASITDNVFKITGSTIFNAFSVPIKTDRIVFIQANLPNMDLGKITTNLGNSDYVAYLKDGYLCVRANTNPAPSINRINFSFEVPFDREIITNYKEVLDNLAFQYEYDQYNRQIAQKTPGKGWEYVVYDQLDRQIMVQDANLRNNNLWLFTKYDAYGRPVYTGTYKSTKTRSALQSELDSFISASTDKANVEDRTSSTTTIQNMAINYSNNAFPNTGIEELLSVSYYDDYNFIDVDKPATPIIIKGQQVTTRTKGLTTSSWVKTLGESTWTKTYTYFDERGRSIKTYEKNHLGGFTNSDTELDFTGKVLESVTTHKINTSAEELLITDRFEYDDTDRLTSQYQTINNQPEELISKFEFDNLGNVKRKSVGGLASMSTPLQNVDYKYNIRGWLQKINEVDRIDNDLFAYTLNYDHLEGGTYANVPALYNGNIAQTIWRSKHDNKKQSYVYQYDALNQLTRASYLSGNSFSNFDESFGVRNIRYDLNGNITSVLRNGIVTNHNDPTRPIDIPLDVLTYNYGAHGNQLRSIEDLGDTNKGFVDGNKTGDDYAYDTNGNLIKDLNKGIELIEYNHLDLVEKVTFANGKSILFTYDASGRKLSKLFVHNGITNTTDYIGGFQYQEGQLQFFPTGEGYARKETGNTFKYVYIYADHLGNNRLSYSDLNGDGTITNAEILSNSNYYPMGGMLEGEFTNAIASNFKYKFQGKELQQDDNIGLYDFGSRMYDPYVGRWFNTDPQNQYNSPYLALGNNYIITVDPDGEWVWIAIGAVVGGAINLAVNWDNIDNFTEGLAAFGTGALAGGLTAACGACGVGAIAALGAGTGALTMATNNVIGQTGDGVGLGDVQWDSVGKSAFIGGITGAASSVASTWATNALSAPLINNLKIASPVLQGGINGTIGGAAGGFAGGFTGGLLAEGTIDGAINAGIDGLSSGAIIGLGSGLGVSYANARLNNIDPWNAKPVGIDNVDITPKGLELVKKHLSRSEFDFDYANEVMIRRLEQIIKGKLTPTKQDLNFYTHEIRENYLMNTYGKSYKKAHEQSLLDYNIDYKKGFQPKLYTIEAIKTGDGYQRWQHGLDY